MFGHDYFLTNCYSLQIIVGHYLILIIVRHKLHKYTNVYAWWVLAVKYWCENSSQTCALFAYILSTYRILEENEEEKEQGLSSQGYQLERNGSREKKNNVQQENTAQCLQVKSAAGVTSNLLLAQVQLLIHRIHLRTFRFDYVLSYCISHRDKLVNKSLFKVW